MLYMLDAKTMQKRNKTLRQFHGNLQFHVGHYLNQSINIVRVFEKFTAFILVTPCNSSGKSMGMHTVIYKQHTSMNEIHESHWDP